MRERGKPVLKRPRKGDWLAVLEGRDHAVRVIEVVEVLGGGLGVRALPDDGRSVAASTDRCLEFVRPPEGGLEE